MPAQGTSTEQPPVETTYTLVATGFDGKQVAAPPVRLYVVDPTFTYVGDNKYSNEVVVHVADATAVRIVNAVMVFNDGTHRWQSDPWTFPLPQYDPTTWYGPLTYTIDPVPSTWGNAWMEFSYEVAGKDPHTSDTIIAMLKGKYIP